MHQSPCSDVAVDVSGDQEYPDCFAKHLSRSLQFGVQAACGQNDQASLALFQARGCHDTSKRKIEDAPFEHPQTKKDLSYHRSISEAVIQMFNTKSVGPDPKVRHRR